MITPPDFHDHDMTVTPTHVHQIRSVALTAFALLLVLYLHLMPALFSGIGGFVLYRSLRKRVRSHLENRGAWITYMLVAIVLAALGFAVFEGFELLLSASTGGLAKLLRLLADTLDQIRTTAPAWVVARLPDSAATLQEAVSGWLRVHAEQVQQWGRDTLRVLVYLLLGTTIGVLAGAAPHHMQANGPFTRLAQTRLLQLALAFRDIIAAQLRISLVNSLLTALYLMVILPLLGYHVPMSTTLVAFTFFASMLPIIGNLLSNTAIVVAALTVSPWLGGVSLAFLVIVHKLEYFLNAHFVGTRIQVPAYGLLASMLVLEASFGTAGLVAAPVYCAWLTRELRGGRWI